ncbi:hypothetical protein BD626DRAFT_562812 [Schizophyllum amplum]|uniref:Uncharacterized protein n=1 Tax=Schizophyllum amplum TaxID=97359 RepID=A0A550CW22_9AGAR|nr:hypothetical protein BD626DRAFT_562812 [Auriculariopsis ampla]
MHATQSPASFATYAAARYDHMTSDLATLFTLPYNTPSSLESQDRLDEEFDTLSAIGCAELAILYLPRHQRLVTSRPMKIKSRPPLTVEQVLETAGGVKPSPAVKPKLAVHRDAVDPQESTAKSTSALRQPLLSKNLNIAKTAAPAKREKAAPKSDKPLPTAEQIIQRAREQEAAEDAALRAFYAKFPELAALKAAIRQPEPATGLLTPPATPPAASRVAHSPVANSTADAQCVAPLAEVAAPQSRLAKRKPMAPTTPVSAPLKASSKIPREASSRIPRAAAKKRKENDVPKAGRKSKADGGLGLAGGLGGNTNNASGLNKENGEAVGKSCYPTYAPTKYGAQPVLGRKRQHSAIIGRPTARIL